MHKKLLFSLVIIGALCISAKAQISVDSLDMPSVGDTAIIGIDTLLPASIMVGDTGVQSWDFSALQPDEFDTLMYVDPATTPDGANFPNSNLAIMGVQPMIFQTLDTMALITDGYAGEDPFGAGLNVVAPFSPTQLVLDLPSTTGSSFIDTSGFNETISAIPLGLPFPDLDSIRVIHSSYVTSVMDAYGTVEIPGGGSYNVVRQLYTEITIDSLFIHCKDTNDCFVVLLTLPFGWSMVPDVALAFLGTDETNPIIDTTYTYKWWAIGESVPVVEVVTDAPGGNALSARFKLTNQVVAFLGGTTDVPCNADSNGSATCTALGGSTPYTYSWNTTPVQTNATATGLPAGTYDVMVIDATGDTSNAFGAIVGEPAILTVGVTSPMPDSGNADGTVSATPAGGTSPYNFVWNTIPPQTAGTATNLTFGMYTVVVTDDNGCTVTDSGAVILFVGIEKFGEGAGEVLLYPNPASSEMNVVSTIADVQFFNVYDITGKQVLNVNIESGTNTLTISDLTNGMYVYQIVNKSGEVIKNGKFSVHK